MEGEQKRVFLVITQEEIDGIQPPKGIYFTKFLSAAEEILDLCQYFGHKKLKGYADFFNSSSSFCCGVI